MNLYEIKEEFLTLLDAIANGEIPDEAVADTLESMLLLVRALNSKLSNNKYHKWVN